MTWYFSGRLGTAYETLSDPLDPTGIVKTPVLRARSPRRWVNETKEPPMKYLLCRAHDLADVTDRTAQASKLPGMRSVKVTLNREILVATEFVHSLIRARIEGFAQPSNFRSLEKA